jgi:excisionase family DNA binding protein
VGNIDLSTWLTKREVAQRLNVAEKTVERLIGRGKIQKQTRKVPTGRPEVVCHPGDVQQLVEAAESEAATPYVMPPEVEQRSVAKKSAVENPQVLELLAEFLVSQHHKSSDVASKMVLTIKEAAAVSGWSQAYIERAIKDQRLEAVKDNGWKIRRASLEKL